MMFDMIGEPSSPYGVAEEWREGRHAGSTDSDNFQAGLDRILSSFKELRRSTSANNISAFFQSVEHQLAGKSSALGKAISEVASVESNLDRLLAARDELAVDILEALQMVRLLASHSLTILTFVSIWTLSRKDILAGAEPFISLLSWPIVASSSHPPCSVKK
jgi:hypothetical protein